MKVINKYNHITDSDRLEIEQALKDGMSLKKIAAKINKHHSTVAREIRARSVESLKGAMGRIPNRCVESYTCKKIQLCMDKPDCVRRCSVCSLCNKVCSDFKEKVCEKLSTPPYVCNGCKEEHKCVLRKKFYLHKNAHQDYREHLIKSREGANITEDELMVMDALLTPKIRSGQSVHHVVVNNRNLFNVHEKTIYRYIAGGLLHVKNGDMPRVCMIKPRRKKPVEHKVDSKCRIGRTHDDFKAFITENPDLHIIEMDSVIGRIGGKVLLTLYFCNSGLMLAFLREHNDSQSVIDIFSLIWNSIGEERFRQLFQVLLTDNGTEFSNPCALENAPDGSTRLRVFYCNPYSSWQKGGIERNHEFLRMILPGGTSFDKLTQEHINTVLSHINSYSRPKRSDKTPYEIFEFTYGAELLGKLGLRKISPNDIVLKPSLLS